MTAFTDRLRHLTSRRLPSDFGYGAFISYSGGRDRDLIPQIQHGVEKLATRWYRPPAMRVFLDKTSISAGPKLWSKIEYGLSRSEWLIVMASPEAAASEWVDREIRWWSEHRSVDNMLLVLTEGTLSWDETTNDFDPASTALPPCLRGRFAEEPVWVSVTWTDEGGKHIPDVERVVLDVASVIRGVPKDQLASAALKEHRRTMRWAVGAAGVLAVLLVAALVFATTTVMQRDRANRNFQQATASRLAVDSRSLLSDPQHLDDVRAIQEALVSDKLSPNPSLLLQTLLTTSDINKVIKTGKPFTSGLDLASGTLDPRALGIVYGVAFNPEGSRIITAGAQIRLWNTDTGQRETQFDSLLPVQSVAVSPDGHRIVTGGLELRLWDDAGKPVTPPLEGHEGRVNSVSFSPDGHRIVSGSEDGTLRIWNADNGLPVGQPMSGHAGAVRAVAFSADGGRIFSGGLDHTVRTWDTLAQKPIGHAVDVGSEVTSLAVSSDNRRVATADAKGGVHLFDPSADNAGDRLPTPSQNWASGKNSLFAMAFSPDGLRLIAGGMDGVIHVWGVEDRTHLGEAHGHTGWITSLAFSRDGRRVASSSHDGTVRIWNVGKHRSGGYQIFGPGSPDGTAPFARSVSMSPDSRHLAAGYQDGSLWIFDTDTGRQAIPPMQSDGGTVETSQFGPDGHYIASAAMDRKVRVWDAGSGQRIAESRPAHTDTIVQLIFSPDGSHLLSTSEDTTQLWDIKSQSFVGAPLDGAEQYFGNIAFSPDGRLIAGGAKDHSIRVWNANTGEPARQPLTGHADTISRVAFSPDGHRMVSISPDSLRLWDTTSWQLVGKPQRNTNIFASLAVSPTGDFFVTGGLGSIQRWNMNTGEPIGDPMPGHQGGVGDLAVTSDGKFIISGSMDSTLRFWDSKSGSPVGDPLTADSQSIATLTVRSDRRILSMDINLSADQTVSAWIWPAPAAWHDDLCKKLSYNMSDDQWDRWVSPDIKSRELCEGLPRLDSGG